LLAREVRSPSQASLGLADLVVTRNAYGRQIASGVRARALEAQARAARAVFIRAPIIESHVAPDVEVLATEAGHPVLVRQGTLLLSTFHPELTDDGTVHEYFLRLAGAAPPTPRETPPRQDSRIAQPGRGAI
jgi:5'-phosphate synthase pdxT subunit